ncbi:1743_t:CDS:2 [Cetraspora pellucida]|uniref:1743_t:CDS:1 n=1 Tax=Cetraspora pellucida TaxID=1433469 RepID=A0A9N9FGA2_9GLOM|nr:1743_t:CDS:2 [Cetraspora pellucida]
MKQPINLNWESRLRDKKVTEMQPIEKTIERQEIEIINDSINKKSGSTSKPKRKLGLSMIEILKFYNRKNLAKVLKRMVLLPKTNFINYEEATINIVSKRLLNKIGLEIDEESLIVIVIVMRAKAKTLEKQKLYLKYLDKLAEVLISNTRAKILVSDEEVEFDNENKDTFDEFDYEEKEEPGEPKGLFTENWPIMYKENPALYLTNIKEVPSQGREKEKKHFKKKLQELLNNKFRTTAVEKVEQAQKLAKKRHDRQLRIMENLEKGNSVLVYKASQATSRSNKLDPK